MVSQVDFINACLANKVSIVRQYIAEGGNVNVKSIASGWTGLIWAAYYDRTECVQELIAAGADVNAVCKDSGNTALIWTAYWGHIDCMRMLITAGTYINAKDNTGWTAIMRALNAKQYEAAQLLVAAGADIYAKNNDGIAAIDYCRNKRVKAKLIKISQRHITAAIKSADKPDIIQGFDPEL